MSQLFYSLAILACPLGMGAMMWMMMRSGKQQQQPPRTQTATADEVTRLRAEVDQLKAATRDNHPAPAIPEDRHP